MHKRFWLLSTAIVVALVSVVLGLARAGRVRPGNAVPEATSTVTPDQRSPTPPPTATPTATCLPRPAATIDALPVFTSTVAFASVHPQTYITDVCQYLRERWEPGHAAPGTVVVPVMFHTVFEGMPYRPGDTHIPAEDLRRTVETARGLGFQTITALQLADFLERNAPIPPRSMIWILDDRHPDLIEKYFLPIARENQWTVTLGWIVGDTGKRKGLWKQMEDLNATGYLDVQSHGYAHLYVQPDTPEALIRQELVGPIAVTEEHFAHPPIAFVWPGGNFTLRSVQLAREAGYRIAFTIYARGPLMYNWIPQGKQERTVGDPLLVLPRFWARPDLPEVLQQAADLGNAAAARAQEERGTEAGYYRQACGCELPSAAP